ncbi:MAG: mandelate racemase/muconate lactonizing enzyme family protein [Rhodospirillales bacterium]|nr:mandelate racemase/muconate lactonizing enzyme family protein [Rhodospirillales bacterium]MBT4038734.1 mandelate racemase/muconate lactonizing enzyme family protein [Rhodospirillales bacterium]MBT4627447.1 mandelate racemase/muconate lactonizing enzyme family protein [Rhodospirillales bacterium]MBT5353360.1 mandelate racemase/muconate lactonizing enzyme family protein [Rhodospirillales bacterium]MBT6109615.1 mandelate racemase/muconate lactonizing enzyme family protein [Rhodospirillales bact
MKITALKTYIVPAAVSETAWCRGANWVLVNLTTEGGISGWGEAYAFGEGGLATAKAIQNLTPIIIGMDPFHIRRFKTQAHDTIGDALNGIEISAAAAGIEIAMWDSVGKAMDTPVHNLLGGPCRDRISVYANCWSHDPRTADQLATFAGAQVERGFRSVKIYPFLYGNTVDDGIEALTAVRDAVGADVPIMIDMWSRMRPEELPRIADALHAQNVPWFEDPAAATDVETLARIRAQSKLTVVSGETLYKKQDFRRLLEHESADILNPDISACGILGLTEIATLAEAYGAKVSVHNNNSMTIGLAMAMQAAAVIPNFTMVEHFPRFIEGSNTFASFPAQLDENGCIPLSNEPGLGVTVNGDALVEYQVTPD